MTNWIDIRWFAASDYAGAQSSTTTVVTAENLAQDSFGVDNSNTSGASEEASTADSSSYFYTNPAGGSGTVPSIAHSTDYWLRDALGAVITNETGNGITLEGLSA